ncbi:MAG: 23S rRNA (adenine(2503)-C(2))-methyltransferase RlmN [Verrucomicrobia bacterium]|nr:23S rRNA (adenine(2503)-C(2))-methyltransferase RlmN [Verrucomicrobiota bacterium]
MNIVNRTFESFFREVASLRGMDRELAAAAYREIFQRGLRSVSNMSAFAGSPELSAAIDAMLEFPECRIVEQHDDGGVLKFVSALGDGETIESVIIPDKGRSTLCVSSQVGCRMGCKFCVTGEMGLRRHLAPQEIVNQVLTARFTMQRPVTNIVFMGMGEPLDNVEAVIQAIRVMADQRGLNIPYSHISVSTAGHVHGIRRLAAEALPNLRLAVSIHAGDDALRNQLVPLNVRYPLAELKQALREFPVGRNGIFFIEYVLLAGVNDGEEHATALINYLEGLPVRVNVIPYNGGSKRLFITPSKEQVDRFCNWLTAAGLFVRRRHPKGRKVMAACGQLGARPRRGADSCFPTVQAT